MNEQIDFGFDPSRTRDNLVAWLRANGVAVPVVAPDPALTEDEREAMRWKQAESAAIEHMNFHGVPCEVRVDGGAWQQVEQCKQKPCKLSGVSCGLFELCRDWRAREQADFSIGVDAVAMVFGELSPTVIAMVERAASDELGQLDQTRNHSESLAAENEAAGKLDVATLVRSGVQHVDLLVRERRRTLQTGLLLAETLKRANGLIGELRGSEEVHGTPHRPLPSKRGAGRPLMSLLTATLQHLKHGGLEYRVIAELVAGMGGGASSADAGAVKEQIRKKIKGRDLRTIRPYEE